MRKTTVVSTDKQIITVSTAKERFLQSAKPLLTLKELAALLSRSSEGLRYSLRADTEFAHKINAARTKIGRRVYFFTEQIATAIGLS